MPIRNEHESTNLMESRKLVSIHGGHSGEFCCHAKDTLEEIIASYAGKRFHWVGITEHIPPIEDRFMYPEEVAAGFDSQTLYHRFDRYIVSCRELQRKYAGTLQIYTGFETEYYSGSISFTKDLIRRFRSRRHRSALLPLF